MAIAESSGMVPKFGAGKRFLMYTESNNAPNDIKEVLKQITGSKKPRQRNNMLAYNSY